MNLPPLIILSGGLGTRVSHISGELPKSLIPINGEPFLLHQLRLLQKSGFRDIILSVKHKENEIRRFVENNRLNDLSIEVISDGQLSLGTGGAVLKCMKNIGPEFIVMYGDSYLNINFNKFYLFSKEFPSCMVIYKNNNKFDKSNVKKITGSKINYIKGVNDSDYNYIDSGAIYFKSRMFEAFAINPPFDLSTMLEMLSKSGMLNGFEVFERFFEIGSANGIEEFRKHLIGESI